MLMEKVLFESRHRKAEILFGSLLGMMHKFVFIEGGRKLTPKVFDLIVECQPVIEHFPRLSIRPPYMLHPTSMNE